PTFATPNDGIREDAGLHAPSTSPVGTHFVTAPVSCGARPRRRLPGPGRRAAAGGQGAAGVLRAEGRIGPDRRAEPATDEAPRMGPDALQGDAPGHVRPRRGEAAGASIDPAAAVLPGPGRRGGAAHRR